MHKNASRILKLAYQRGYADLPQLDIDTIRAFLSVKQTKKSLPAKVEIDNRTIPLATHNLSSRFYFPEKLRNKHVICFFHGGGMISGNAQQTDLLCADLSAMLEDPVIAINYRLAPEHKFPAAINDAIDSIQWIHNNCSNLFGRELLLSVIGESSGGNLAAVASQVLRQQNIIQHQFLINPSLDYCNPYQSKQEYAENYLLDKAFRDCLAKHYLNNENERTQYKVSPVLNPDLKKLPPATIIASQYDPMRDEAAYYAEQLINENNHCQFICMLGMIHGFLQYKAFFPEEYDLALKLICSTLDNSLVTAKPTRSFTDVV
jgi:acetyl esterase